MRWLYPDELDHEEAASRRAVISRIEHWWQAFARRRHDIAALFTGEQDWDLAAFMRAHLERVDERLSWEFGPALAGDGDRLVVTPEGDLRLRPLVDEIIRRAPRLDGWEYYHSRLAEPLEVAVSTTEELTEHAMGRVNVSASVRSMNRVDLAFWMPDAADKEFARAQAVIATGHLLGEEALSRWIGNVEVQTQREGDAWMPLDALPGTVFSEVAGIDSVLPAKPLHELVDELKWSLWRLTPPERQDYARHEDLLMGSSALDEMSHCAQLGVPFDSRRYSKVGETFAYVKFDGEGRKMAARMQERKALEAALNTALVTAGVGCVVGTGTGRRYSYLDLALSDVAKALPLIREVGRSVGLAKRSWVQFHDEHLGDEWAGIHEDTPPPPR